MAYKLTPLGNSAALRVDTVKDPEAAIVSYMYEQKDALEIEEIVGETRLSEERAEMVLNRLISKGHVKEV